MHAEVVTRMLAPLLVLEAAGPLRSKVQLRTLALLAQRELPGDAPVSVYRHEAGRYGPRCGLLDRDASDSPSLVGHGITLPTPAMPRFGHSYRITEQGARHLVALKDRAGPELIRAAEGRIRDLLADAPVTLMDDAYRMLGPKASTARLEEMVAADIAMAMPPIRKAYKSSAGRHSVAVAAVADSVEAVLSDPNAKAAGDAQRRTILCMSGEIIGECSRVCSVDLHGDHYSDHRIADADDLMHTLAMYCEKSGIAKDPITVPARDLLSEEDVLLLCKEIENE